MLEDERDPEEGGGNGTDARRHSIHVVEQIERVGQRDEAKQRREHVDEQPGRERQRGAGRDERDSREELQTEFELWTQRDKIVDETDAEHEARTQGDGSKRERYGCRGGVSYAQCPEQKPGEQSERGRDRDGDATEQRRRPLVPPIGARARDPAGSEGQPANDRRARQPDQAGERRDHRRRGGGSHTGWGLNERSYSITDVRTSSRPISGSQAIAARILSSEGMRRGMSSKSSPYTCS